MTDVEAKTYKQMTDEPTSKIAATNRCPVRTKIKIRPTRTKATQKNSYKAFVVFQAIGNVTTTKITSSTMTDARCCTTCSRKIIPDNSSSNNNTMRDQTQKYLGRSKAATKNNNTNENNPFNSTQHNNSNATSAGNS